jgi:hypothetical protein
MILKKNLFVIKDKYKPYQMIQLYTIEKLRAEYTRRNVFNKLLLQKQYYVDIFDIEL